MNWTSGKYRFFLSTRDNIILKVWTQNDVGLGEPDYMFLSPQGCESRAQQTAYMLIEIEKILEQEKPDMILVYGDANTIREVCKMSIFPKIITSDKNFSKIRLK